MIKKRLKVIIALVLFPVLGFSFMGTAINFLDDAYRASCYVGKITKAEYGQLLLTNPNTVRACSALSKMERMKPYIGLAAEKGMIAPTKQTYYLNRFNKIDGGDKLLLDAIKNNKNLDDILANPPMTNQFIYATKTMVKTTQAKVIGMAKDLKTNDIYKNGYKVAEGKATDFYDIKKSIPMLKVSVTHAGKNSTGYMRDPKIFWKGYLTKYGDDLSPANQKSILQNRSPIVDDIWIKAYPKHKPFKGDTLIHHHVHHGSEAVPLPKTLHVENSKIFHSL